MVRGKLLRKNWRKIVFDHVSKVFIDADSLVYINAWAAQQTHYMPLFKGKPIQDEPFRYAADYKKYVKAQKEELQPFFEAEKIEHVLDLRVATGSIDKAILYMRKKFGIREVQCFITDEEKTNNRYEIATILPYKGQRSDKAKPLYYQECRQHLIEDWRAEVIVGEEADDAVVQKQWEHYQRLREGTCDSSDLTMIAHIDKDINMCPGWHYNFSKDHMYWISEIDGMRNFYTQLITGDIEVDNIPGLKYITGKNVLKKYKDGLLQLVTEKQMYDYVYDLYEEFKPDTLQILDADGDVEVVPYPGTEVVLHEIGNLLYMRRKPMEVWSAPT